MVAQTFREHENQIHRKLNWVCVDYTTQSPLEMNQQLMSQVDSNY